ncbi:MAG: tetratricopeptide repeat protein, partial [Bryobacteraceae bacterium]
MTRRAPFLLLFFVAALIDAQMPPASGIQTEKPLAEAQSLIDLGKTGDAESAIRRYLETHKDSADGHYLLGYVLFREQNPKASIAAYTEAAQYRPPSALDLQAVGSDYFLMEDYASADKWFTKSVDLSPKDPLGRYYLGRTKYNEKHFTEAARAFIECLKLDPKNTKAEDNLGLSYEELGKTDDALTAYRAAVALDGSSATRNFQPYLDLGALLAGSGRAAEALPYLNQAVQLAAGDARAHRELGKAYLRLSRFEEARSELEKAADLAPQDAPTHFLLAQAFRGLRMMDKANSEGERYAALTGAHSSPDTPLEEARSLLGSGKLDEAERVTRQYLTNHKNSADGHYLLGYVLFKKRDAKSSLAEYTEGAKYRRPDAADLEVVASDYVLLNDFPDADKWYTQAVKWNPGDSLGWYYLGRTKYNENRFEEAIAAFEHCLKIDPKNVKAEDNLGLSYAGLNRTGEAMAAYKNAIAWQAGAGAKDSGPFLDLGTLLVDNNRANEAIPHLLDGSLISPDDYRIHRELGKAYEHVNELD